MLLLGCTTIYQLQLVIKKKIIRCKPLLGGVMKKHIQNLYSLRIVKEVVSDIDTVSKNNLDHYIFAIKNHKIQSIYTFTKLHFKMNLFTLLLYFQTQSKRIYLQSKVKIFKLKQTQNDFLYNTEGVLLLQACCRARDTHKGTTTICMSAHIYTAHIPT